MYWLALACMLPAAADEAPRADKYFKITVVDDQTGRGVPLVELETVGASKYVTDSNGVVAFREPGLMDQTVHFTVRSHGYEFPKDGFGYRGKALQVKEGGSATLRIKRINIAERLYRVTGGGIYADTVLLGEKPPTREPVLNAQVLGSDSVVNAIYKGKLYWFWGDTNKPSYILGNFHVPGATSPLPGKDVLDHERGVDLSYFVDAKGFAKQTCKMPGDGPTWIGGAFVLPDGKKQEHLFANYVKVRKQMEVYEKGLVEWDDDAKEFKKVATFDLKSPVGPNGNSFLFKEDGVEYVYFAHPFPMMRVRADLDQVKKAENYEAFTCLKEGTRVEDGMIDRDGERVRYSWKKNTAPIGPNEMTKLVKAGKLKEADSWTALRDADTGKAVGAHGGSVYWNEYRKKWVLVVLQFFGTSLLGEMWYAEADTPLGPWVYARKIVTHDKYSFYNPKQHPYFDKDGGRFIFFEGTYTHTFSGNNEKTPRYDYNQVMYKLDLADERMALPVAVYRDGDKLGTAGRAGIQPDRKQIAFFALDRAIKGTTPVHEQGGALKLGEAPKGVQVVFHALPADARDALATTVPLFEYTSEDGKRRLYSTEESRPGWTRSKSPLCRVWRNPLSTF